MKKLLIVVDMLNDFCHKNGVLSHRPSKTAPGDLYAADAIMYGTGVVDTFRRNNDTIIWLGDWHKEDDEEFKRFPKHAVMNTWGAEVIADLLPEMIESSPSELKINKTRYSGFYGTDLEYQLARLAPEEVTVIGVCTSICVMDTVGGLVNRDYKTIVREKCVADFDPAAHTAALARMTGLYGAKIV